MKNPWKRTANKIQFGLGIEYLRMVAIPTCLLAFLLNGFWILSQWLQHQPIPRFQSAVWALVSMGTLMELIWLPNRKWLIIACSMGQILLMAVFSWTTTQLEPLAVLFTILLLSLHIMIVAIAILARTHN